MERFQPSRILRFCLGALALVVTLQASPSVAAEPVAATEGGPEAFSFAVRAIQLDGATVFNNGELSPIVQDAVGENMTLADLQQVAQRIALHYRERGYPFAYAYVPPQDVEEDGVVTIAVVEGRYSAVAIDNDSMLREQTARNVLGSVREGELIQRDTLERSMRRLGDLPGVRARSVLRTGDDPGTAELVVRLEDERRFAGTLSVDNFGNPLTGRVRGLLAAELNNVTGRGDRMSAQALTSGAGLLNGRLSYGQPFGDGGYRWNAAYQTTRYELGGDFTVLEAEGTADVVHISVQDAAVRTSRLNVDLQLSYEHKELKDKVLGAETPRRADVFGLMASGERRFGEDRRGIDRFSAQIVVGQLSIDDPVAREQDALSSRTAGSYTKIGASLMRQQPLGERFALRASASGQWASKNLHGSEKLSLGGPAGVRAYPAGEAVGDEGWLARLELQYRTSVDGVHGAGFVDGGGVRINKNPWVPGKQNTRDLYGAGVGLIYAPSDRLSIRADYAWPFGNAEADEPEHKAGQFWVHVRWQM